MAQLRIGIDGYNLAMAKGTGIATYGFNLARAVQRSGHRAEGVFGIDTGRDPALREVLFFDAFARDEPSAKPRRETLRDRRRLRHAALNPLRRAHADEVPLTDRVQKDVFADRFPPFDRLTSSAGLFELAHLRFRFTKRFLQLRMDDPPDIMHWTYPVPIELAGARNVYTLHDLVPLRLPYTTLDSKTFYRGIAQGCVTRGAHVCTVSEASRADIVAEFGISPDDVTNAYQSSVLPAAMPEVDPAADAAILGSAFGLAPQGYFLFFGAIEPKKNLGRLLEAYLSIQSRTPLVIVGARAWQSESELRLLPAQGAATDSACGDAPARIIRLEYLQRTLLLRLIRSARAVAFPSLYEGFGLPVLEAMQLGTPVLTANTGSLPEVAGDAAVSVDPYSIAAIAAGLRRLDEDADLRARLSEEGRVQAAKFSEAHFRARLDAMYARIMAAPQ